MTLGTAARRSIKNSNVSESLGGASSARKMAAPIPRGIAIMRATTYETKVPYMKGSAPYSSAIGSQTSVNRKRKPNLCRGSAEFVHSCQTSITVIKTTVAANRKVIRRAISSPEARRDRKERESEDGLAPLTVVLDVATVLPYYWMLPIAFFSISTTSLGSFA